MRYTARARMLSWDFPSDAAVQSLPAEHALALSFMIARADNLGRLPGEPEVLLAHLFTPKRPRADFSSDMLTECLWNLAGLGIVVWYEVEGTRFVQLAKWSGHQSIRSDLRKSDLPAPSEGVVLQHERLCPEEVATLSGGSRAEVATTVQRSRDKVAPEVEVEEEGEEEAEPRLSFASLKKVELHTCKELCGEMWTNSKDASGAHIEGQVVSALKSAEKTAARSALEAREHVPLVHDALKAMGATPSELAVGLGIANRLYRDGLKGPTCLRLISEHWFIRRAEIRNPWAYFNTRSEKYRDIIATFSARATIEDHQAQEKATRDWLAGLSAPKKDA